VNGPNDHEIERRIVNGQKPALAFDLGWPACVCPCRAGCRLAKWRLVGGGVYHPFFPGSKIGRTHDCACVTARLVDSG
jgi:hypothetical protein